MAISETADSCEEPSTESRHLTMGDVAWSWLDLLVVFAPVVARAVAGWANLPIAGWFQAISAPAYLLTFVWMIAYPAWLAYRRVGWKPRWPGIRALAVESAVAFGFVIGSIVISNLIQIVADALFGDAAKPGLTHEASFRTSARNVAIFTVIATTIGPIAEEFAFRGVLFNRLRRRMPMVLAVVAQGILFGVYHPFSTVVQVQIAVMGCLLGLIYWWRGTLLAPILSHGLMNGLVVAMTLAGASPLADTPVLGVRCDSQAGQCLVIEVIPGTAAETAGLKVGDVILDFAGEPVPDMPRLTRLVSIRGSGDKVKIKFRRDGESREVEAILKRWGDR